MKSSEYRPPPKIYPGQPFSEMPPYPWVMMGVDRCRFVTFEWIIGGSIQGIRNSHASETTLLSIDRRD
jgi:hypothetical protein